LGRALEAGDLVVAQIAHRAMGELIAQAMPEAKAAVVDLSVVRRNRDRRPPGSSE
jgi:hypothetical protein